MIKNFWNFKVGYNPKIFKLLEPKKNILFEYIDFSKKHGKNCEEFF